MIFLARHGETDDNAPPRRVQGRRDPPLNERGREQAAALARSAAALGIAALWTSHQRRARETADVLSAALGLEPRVDRRLAEADWGRWEGRLVDDIARDEPELWAAWGRSDDDFRFPEGESLAEHLARVTEALDDIAAGPVPALVVCHGGTIRCALARERPGGLADVGPLRVPNAELIELP